MSTWLEANGDDVFRTKGILAVDSDDRFHVLQAVHKLIDFRADHGWGTDNRFSKLVFIGRNLDRARIGDMLEDCLA